MELMRGAGLLIVAAVISAVAGCGTPTPDTNIPPPHPQPDGASAVMVTPKPEPEPSVRAPARSPVPAQHESALHNVHRASDKLISGALPDGDAAFDELARMGVKTVISVDGAHPDIARAEARGMRYVHLPHGYNGIDAGRQLELARAIRDLPGPIYLHCHHGKHRGPAAAATATILLGEMTPEEGCEFLKTAGTAPAYLGLYRCVAMASAVDAETVDSASDAFPAVAPAPGFVQAMVEMQHAVDHLAEIKAAGWSVPAEHPDLVPLDEAGRLTDLLRASHADAYTTARSEAFARHLLRSIEASQAVEDHLLSSPADAAGLTEKFRVLSASCTDCHAAHRDTQPLAPNVATSPR